MQYRNSMPFFWPKLVAQGLFIGALVSGCAAGGGSLEGESGDDSGFAPSAPAAPQAPTLGSPAANPAPAPVATSGSTTSPVTSAPVANAPGNAGSEVLPEPQRDDDAQPANPGADDGAAPGDDDRDDDDRDDDGDDDDDDDRDDDDDSDGDDDDRDDDEDDDRDDDDDDDDDVGVTPPPNPGTPPDPGTPPPNPDAVTFSADIRPILIENCGRCHASGGLPQFASANAATAYDVAFRERDEIVSEIRRGSMPADTCNGAPGSNGCVSVADFNLIQQWVAAGAPE